MGTWHNVCGTAHCRAGWAVHLAGEAGYDLERFYGGDTLIAAMMIYDASDPSFKINPCRFFDEKDDALDDMKALAEWSGP